jgi:hypothetical protein
MVPPHYPGTRLQREVCPRSVLPGQGGFEVDGYCREGFGDRAICFGIQRKLLEGLFVYAWHHGLGLQVDRVVGDWP